jgi:hypothetical protein
VRTRYRYDADLDAVVQIHDHNGPEVQTFHGVMPDIRHFTTQDGVEITSRSKLRAYERATGTRQVGNDWSGPSKPAWWDQVSYQERERARRG